MEKNWNEMTRLEKLMQILDEEEEEKNKEVNHQQTYVEIAKNNIKEFNNLVDQLKQQFEGKGKK